MLPKVFSGAGARWLGVFLSGILVFALGERCGLPRSPRPEDAGKEMADSAKMAAVVTPTLGSVAYYCPSKMVIDQVYFVTVTIAKEQLDTLIHEVQRMAAEIQPGARPGDVKGDTLQIAHKMKVVLVAPSDFFKKIDTPAVSGQDFGQGRQLTWEWALQPTTVAHSITIAVHIYAYDLNQDGQWVEVTRPVKSFDIDIQIDPRTFWDKTLTFLGDDPKFLLAQILIPLVSFFGGLLLGRRKRKAKA